MVIEKNKNRIKELRKKKKDSLLTLSGILKTKYNINVTDGQLSQYENRLKELRTRDKKTQQNIADLFGVSKMAVKRWETGENDMKPYVIERLADYFGVSISYFLKMSDSPDGNDKPTGFDSVEEYEKARKELLEKIANNPNSKQIGIAHGADGPFEVDLINKNLVLDIISQIDEPQKVVVPEFIDSYIRYAKAEGMSLFIAMDNAQNKESEWIITSEETFARAWLDGYKVGQEKLYTVEIADVILTKITRGRNIQYKMLPSKDVFGIFDKDIYATHLTEIEIKQKDECLWQFAKEVEE